MAILRKEDGDALLLESGDHISLFLEHVGGSDPLGVSVSDNMALFAQLVQDVMDVAGAGWSSFGPGDEFRSAATRKVDVLNSRRARKRWDWR